MKPNQLSSVYETRDAIVQNKAISTTFQEVLEERLPIYCKPFTRQPPRKGRTNQEHKVYQRNKRAHNVYLEVFEIDPHILLPFIICVSPGACRAFDVSAFRRQHCNRRAILPGNNSMKFFEEIALRQGINICSRYRELMLLHFPRGRNNPPYCSCGQQMTDEQVLCHTPSPPTGAQVGNKWAYDHFTLDFIRNKFGDKIIDAIERSPVRMVETGKGAISRTNCVRMNFPEWPGQDAIVWLNVGMATDLAAILFPGTSSRVLSSPVDPSTEKITHRTTSACQQQGNDVMMDFGEGDGRTTTKGASMKALSSIFSQSVCDAIESSQLRLWEISHQIYDTTDCVELQAWRSSPHSGVICLRIEFNLAMHIVNDTT
ncbi:hypothetical protein N7522_006364 [Penicillium canescens]|nr:hypothetical protein N7522_006364 [Penicillium canescens]